MRLMLVDEVLLLAAVGVPTSIGSGESTLLLTVRSPTSELSSTFLLVVVESLLGQLRACLTRPDPGDVAPCPHLLLPGHLSAPPDSSNH